MKKKYIVICGIAAAVCVCAAIWVAMDRLMPVKHPNVLIITMDTTRADHLGCYGYDKIKTPNIDAVAAEGILFEEAFSVQPVTLPSHCSMFTGRYPFSHGVRDNNIYKLADDNITLAEVLNAEGYVTTAFLASYILDRQFGLSQGFRYYNDRFIRPKQKGRLPIDRRASEVSFLACEWLDAMKDELQQKPFFLWLHYYDPHADYNPPYPYKSAYPNSYDGEIAYMDDWIGYFFDELKKRGMWDNTIVILVADHGESLGENGENTHGMFIYRPTTHVPLMIRYPDSLPKGVRIGERVSSVDIMPTVLELLSVKTKSEMDGRSLVPLMKKKQSLGIRSIYSETFIPRGFNWSELKGIRKDGWFFIEAPKPELYVLNPGKTEEGDTIHQKPQIADELKTELQKMLVEADQTRSEEVTVDDDMIERLKSLGYFVGGGQTVPEEENSTSMADPKDKIALFTLQQKANSLSENGRFDEAIDVYKDIIKEDPDNPRFLMEFAELLIRDGKFEEAEKLIKYAMTVREKDARCHFLLGLCYARWGKTRDAISEFSETINQNPRHFLACFYLGLEYIKTYKWDEAEQYFLRAKEIKPDDPYVLNNLGYIAIKGKEDFQSGIGFIEEALKLTPDNAAILSSLGSAYFNKGDDEKAGIYLEAALVLVPDNLQLIRQLKLLYGKQHDDKKVKMLEDREKIIRDYL